MDDDDEVSGDADEVEDRFMKAIDEEVGVGKKGAKPPLVGALPPVVQPTAPGNPVAVKRKREADSGGPGNKLSDLERQALGCRAIPNPVGPLALPK